MLAVSLVFAILHNCQITITGRCWLRAEYYDGGILSNCRPRQHHSENINLTLHNYFINNLTRLDNLQRNFFACSETEEKSLYTLD